MISPFRPTALLRDDRRLSAEESQANKRTDLPIIAWVQLKAEEARV
ncbi:hypothetical protein Tph_c15360 [Thermacetogenium phaeum DSM 12270]|uniref:Uncharacterized protein n=1 Tax=Thermacetogenium phaeum (strain ATCC BAA-254 / DSM 26808 / PB) TaxID=1089553 RepID=K4LI61_THEPS|nr:hypothetical protein Tph_c15360 [Thermacetogenium phaeum DSM 12270]